MIFDGNERVFQAEKRANYIWQREEHMQRYRELKVHDQTENQGGCTVSGVQVHKAVCRDKPGKKNWNHVVCKG